MVASAKLNYEALLKNGLSSELFGFNGRGYLVTEYGIDALGTDSGGLLTLRMLKELFKHRNWAHAFYYTREKLYQRQRPYYEQEFTRVAKEESDDEQDPVDIFAKEKE